MPLAIMLFFLRNVCVLSEAEGLVRLSVGITVS